MMMRDNTRVQPMTEAEQRIMALDWSTVRYIRASLARVAEAQRAEDLTVALARIDNWLIENAGRWVRDA